MVKGVQRWNLRMYKGHRDALSLKRWILDFLPSAVEKLDGKEFRKHVLSKKYKLPWLVDFYAPWCGHCTHFEPTFRAIAKVSFLNYAIGFPLRANAFLET